MLLYLFVLIICCCFCAVTLLLPVLDSHTYSCYLLSICRLLCEGGSREAAKAQCRSSVATTQRAASVWLLTNVLLCMNSVPVSFLGKNHLEVASQLRLLLTGVIQTHLAGTYIAEVSEIYCRNMEM